MRIAGFLACALVAAASAAPAQDLQTVGKGHALYIANCLPCHGADARGTGHIAATLGKPLPDLTRITERDGRFEPVRVIVLINGDRSGEADRKMARFHRAFLDHGSEASRPRQRGVGGGQRLLPDALPGVHPGRRADGGGAVGEAVGAAGAGRARTSRAASRIPSSVADSLERRLLHEEAQAGPALFSRLPEQGEGARRLARGRAGAHRVVRRAPLEPPRPARAPPQGREPSRGERALEGRLLGRGHAVDPPRQALGLERPRVLAERGERLREAVVRRGRRPRQRGGALERGRGLGGAPPVEERAAEQEGDAGCEGVGPARPLEKRHALGVAAVGPEDEREHDEAREVVGLGQDRRPRGALGPGRVVVREETHQGGGRQREGPAGRPGQGVPRRLPGVEEEARRRRFAEEGLCGEHQRPAGLGVGEARGEAAGSLEGLERVAKAVGGPGGPEVQAPEAEASGLRRARVLHGGGGDGERTAHRVRVARAASARSSSRAEPVNERVHTAPPDALPSRRSSAATPEGALSTRPSRTRSAGARVSAATARTPGSLPTRSRAARARWAASHSTSLSRGEESNGATRTTARGAVAAPMPQEGRRAAIAAAVARAPSVTPARSGRGRRPGAGRGSASTGGTRR